MFKRVMVSVSCVSLLACMSLKSMEIKGQNLFTPTKLGSVKLFHNEKGFYVERDGEKKKIQNCFIDKELRNLTDYQLNILLGNIKKVKIGGQIAILERIPEEVALNTVESNNGEALPQELNDKVAEQLKGAPSYIQITEMSNGDYSLRLNHRLLGGGVWGGICGAWAGKFIASAITHGSIVVAGGVISVFATPIMGGAFIATMEGTFGTAIEGFTTAAAVAGGIAGAVATGPV